MSHSKLVRPEDSLAVHRSDDRPLKIDDEIEVVHLNGQRVTVYFDQIAGDKCDQITVRWPAGAGIYAVDFNTGQLVGGRPKRKASVWRVCGRDMDRIRETARKRLEERAAQKKADRLG